MKQGHKSIRTALITLVYKIKTLIIDPDSTMKFLCKVVP